MSKPSFMLMLLVVLTSVLRGFAEDRYPLSPDGFRPPAVQLVAHDPYFSIWSMSDHLTNDVTRHWTKAPMPLSGLIRVDDQTFRLMGPESKTVPAMLQTLVDVQPTRTIYTFETEAINVELVFLSLAVPYNFNMLSNPIAYLVWQVESRDNQSHQVVIYFSTAANLAVHSLDQEVVWSRETSGPVRALKLGTQKQPILQYQGDSTRIGWGYLYLATGDERSVLATGTADASTREFLQTGMIFPHNDAR